MTTPHNGFRFSSTLLLGPMVVAAAILALLPAPACLAGEPTYESPKAFVHPGISHNSEGIAFIRSKVDSGEEPWKSAWDRLRDSRYARLDWEPEPLDHVQRGPSNNPNIGSSDFYADATAAYTHALQWALLGNEEHAQKSAEIINAWSHTLKTVTNHDAKLLIGMTGIRFCNAAELLKHTWGGWSQADQEQFRSMLVDVWYPIIEDFYPSANGNWDASMLQTMIAMGVYLDDHAMFDRAAKYYLSGQGNGSVRNYFNYFGQCQETGRDQAHTQMGLEFLANTCEIAWIQGVDLYGAYDNRLLRGFEYTAKYNLGFDVPYEPYRSFEGRYYYKKISDDSRGRLRPMYEKVLNHYENRRGLEAEYTAMAAEKQNRRRRRHDRASLPWDTLMYTGVLVEAEVPAAAAAAAAE